MSSILEIVFSLFTRFTGLSPTLIGAALVALVGVAGGSVWYGYEWGKESGQNACVAAHADTLKAAIDQRDEALRKIGSTIAEQNAKNEQLRKQAQVTIDQLEKDNAGSQKRIRELIARIPTRCDGHVVIDDRWLRDFSDILTRRNASVPAGAASPAP